jgi:hypothetical protein
MIREGRDIPHQFLALLAGMMIDSVEYRSYRARMVALKFVSDSDAYDLSLFLWRHANRHTRCDQCRKYLEYEGSELHFGVAIDSESIAFLCKRCTAAKSHGMSLIIEGWNYPDVMHDVSVNWRGMEERAVIGNTDALGEQATIEELLDAQRRTQDLAELAALQAEQQRRAQLRVIQ